VNGRGGGPKPGPMGGPHPLGAGGAPHGGHLVAGGHPGDYGAAHQHQLMLQQQQQYYLHQQHMMQQQHALRGYGHEWAGGLGGAMGGHPQAGGAGAGKPGWMRGPTALPIAPRALAPDCRSLSQPLSARPGWSRAPRLALARQAERWRRLGPRRRAQVWGFQTGDEGRLLAYRLSGRGGQTDYRAPRAALPRQHAGALAARPAGEGNQGGNETHASRPTQPMG